MTPDAINGLFELFGAWFVYMNVVQLRKDRSVKGVYFPSMIFFSVWGLWNLYYYPHLNQQLSFYAGVVLTIGNVAWVYLAIKLRYFTK